MGVYRGLTNLEQAWSLFTSDPTRGTYAIGLALLVTAVLVPIGLCVIVFCVWCNKGISSPNTKALIYICAIVGVVIISNELMSFVFLTSNFGEYIPLGQIVSFPLFFLITGYLANRRYEKQKIKSSQ